MFRSIEIPRPSRKLLLAGGVATLAVLLALAVTIEPQRSSSDRSESTSTAGPGGAEQLDGFPGSELVGPTADEAAKSAVEPELDGSFVDGDASPVDIAARDMAAAGGAADVVEPAPSSTLAPPQLDTKIVRTGTVQLDVKRRAFEDSWGEVQSIATAHGGYIVMASRSGAGDAARNGTITMRVPTERFEDALERVRKVDGAKVGGLDVTSQDVTQEYVDVRSRLRHDRAVERRLVALLAEADGVSEVLAVQNRLDAVQEQIEIARGRLNYLDKLTAMSTIQVSLHAKSASSSTKEQDEPGTIAEAFDDAAERFSENVAAAIVWFGGALPTLIVLAIVALIGRVAWRRFGHRSEGTDAPAA